jgi:glycosyltransferase involved in cell wall biosynthesis
LIVAYEKSALCKKGYNLDLAGALGWKNKKIFKKINSNPNIKYIGYVKDEDKKNLYSLAKIFVYPSFYEGFGLPVLEAMQSKLALITSNNSSLGELVSDTALLINPNNVFELQSSMEFLLEKKDFRKSISQKAYLRSKDFSYKNHLDAFLNFI